MKDTGIERFDVRPGEVKKPPVKQSAVSTVDKSADKFRIGLLSKFRYQWGTNLVAASKAKFNMVAMLWNYMHHDLWKHDGPQGDTVRFRNQKQALDYYGVAERSARRYKEVGDAFMQSRYPEGLPANVIFTAKEAGVAWQIWRDKKGVGPNETTKLLAANTDDALLDEGASFAEEYGHELRRQDRERAKLKMKSEPTGAEKLEKKRKPVRELIDHLHDIAKKMHEWRLLEKDHKYVTRRDRDRALYYIKYIVCGAAYPLLAEEDHASRPAFLDYDQARAIESRDGHDMLSFQNWIASEAVGTLANIVRSIDQKDSAAKGTVNAELVSDDE